MKTLIVLTVLTVIVSADFYKNQRRQKQPTSFLCPPNFVRTKHNKCYYFSRNAESFDQAYWSCVSKQSTLAVIRGKNQDKTLRRLLNKNKIQHVERWIGARYNWEKKKWQWAESGKLLNYTGFENTPQDTNAWQCIILDPKYYYRWNSKSCLEKKHFICQTRLKKTNILTNYENSNSTKYDKSLNEVIPEVAHNDIPTNFELNDKFKNTDFIGKTSSAYSPKPRKNKGLRRKGKGRKRKNKKENKDLSRDNETQQDAPIPKEGKMGKAIKYVTYHGEAVGPLHPRIIIEDFDFLKNETSAQN
nr:lithostathine-like [Onthophagus taurus]